MECEEHIPTAVFKVPDVFKYNARLPTAVLLSPVTFSKAEEPTPVLQLPVFPLRALLPTAVFS